MTRTAQTDAPILDLLAERWSTRIFDPEAVLDEDALAAALEAARWAPSAGNSQPWRFLVARRGSDAHRAVFASLTGFNQAWAGAASALIVVLAETETETGDRHLWAAYDAGQAAAHFTVQAHAAGLATHQMGGFVADTLRGAFDIPSRFTPLTVMAVGRLGDADAVSETLRDREAMPRTRRPIAESLFVDA